MVFLYMFWLLFALEFQERNQEEICVRFLHQQDLLRQLFVEKYCLFFSLNCQNEKLMEKYPFVFIQAIVKAFFTVFPSSQLMFNKQFGL